MPDPPLIHRENPAVVGVDVGVSVLATLSTGEKIRGPQVYAATQATLRQLQQHFSRQMEAAKVRAGLKPGEPLPKGQRIPWPKNMVKAQPASPGSMPASRTSVQMPYIS
jgi:putative transposase